MIDPMDYIERDVFEGGRDGWIFKKDEHGLGYYRWVGEWASG